MHVCNCLAPLLPALGLALMGCTESEKSDLGMYAYPEGKIFK
jgi:hypothetical protein